MKPLLHPGAVLIEPFQQGGLDALCGLYALINAVRVLHAPIRPISTQQCKRLFAEGMEFLAAKKGSRNAPHFGMTVARQRKLAKRLFGGEVLAETQKLHLGLTIPLAVQVEELDATLEKNLRARAVLLACFQGRISHHSVIVGRTATRVTLFDSTGMRFVKKSGLRFGDRQTGTLTLQSVVPMVLATKAN